MKQLRQSSWRCLRDRQTDMLTHEDILRIESMLRLDLSVDTFEEEKVLFVFPHKLLFELMSTSICKGTVNAEDAIRRGSSEPGAGWSCDGVTKLQSSGHSCPV